MGYHRAGFEVVGVDIKPQPNYPFEFQQQDALVFFDDVAGWGPFQFDAIHASPPCQAWTAYKRRIGWVKHAPDYIAGVRARLTDSGLPYVIENVEGAPLENPVRICGSSLGLDIRRHRLFETNWPLMAPPCSHGWWKPNRFPGGRSKERTGSSKGPVRATIEIGAWDIPLRKQQKAMEIDWMALEELSEAIPPAYTELIGHQLMQHIQARAAA